MSAGLRLYWLHLSSSSLLKLIITLHRNINFDPVGEGFKTIGIKITLFVLVITFAINILEATVKKLFKKAAAGIEGATIGGAIALAVGIGIQNFPRESR